MTQVDTDDTSRTGNTKLSSRSRSWTFTVNNPDSLATVDTLTQLFGTQSQWIVGNEVGESGTPHWQGFVKFKNARSFQSMKKLLPTAHIEKSKGTIKQNFNYCSKEGNYATNIDLRTHKEKMKDTILQTEYKNVQWKPWQAKVLKELEEKADPRSINWFWENTGNIGKSYLVKYIALTKRVIIADGKKADIFNAVNTMIEKKENPEIIILDIPRHNLEYINYGALEQLKNGCIYSGKYEGGLCLFPIPHVYIFANAEPDTSKMSKDRWNITNLSIQTREG